jgi:hypothetical protein
MSSPSNRVPTLDETLAEWEAEDRAVNYLGTLSHELAVITSVKLKKTLAELWEVEKQAMISRGDPRYVYDTTAEERGWLTSAVAACSKNPLWWSCSVEQVQELFAKLPPDVAAFIAYRVARYECRREEWFK